MIINNHRKAADLRFKKAKPAILFIFLFKKLIERLIDHQNGWRFSIDRLMDYLINGYSSTMKATVLFLFNLCIILKKLTFPPSFEMPYYNGGVQVEKNAAYIKLQSKVGIVVMWNGDDAIMVKTSLVLTCFEQ